jgi:histidinol-phosphate aminotransferase
MLILDSVKQDANIKVLFLCSPGNPTGTLLSQHSVERILASFDGIVFVDEAYIDFEPEFSMVPLLSKYPNLIVSQTLSKAFGLAGARVGFTISSNEIAQLFNKTKAPYNISTLASSFAQKCLSNESIAVVLQNVQNLKREHAFLLGELEKLPFFGSVLGGNHANFILIQVVYQGTPNNELARKLYLLLAQEFRVVVRFRGSEYGCHGALRVTVGTHSENIVLLNSLKSDKVAQLIECQKIP